MKTYVRYHSRHKIRRPVVQTIWDMLLTRKLLVISFFILLIVLPIVLMKFQYTKVSEAGWFDESWLYRKNIAIPSHSTSESNVYVAVPTFDATDSNKFQSDCGDLRFTNQNGEQLQYFVVSCNATATIHVQFKTLPAGATTYYMYYGNSSAQNGFSAADFPTAATGLGSQTLASEEQSQAPTVYWKFDEGYGTTTKDSTSSRYTGSAIVSTQWETEDKCISSKCLYFNGTNNRVDTNTKLSDITSEITVSSWVYPINPPNVVGRIIATTYDWDATPSLQRGWTLGLNYGSTDLMQMVVYDSSGNSSAATLSNFFANYKNKWVHVVGVYKAGQYVRLYINGQLAAENTSNIISAIAPGTINNLRLGTRADTTGQAMWDGRMDEVKIYSYSRTPAQIKSDFASKGGGIVKGTSVSTGTNAKNNDAFSNGLVTYWKFDEASGNGMDSSGNTNGTTVSGSNNYSIGKFGNGLRSGVLTTNLEQNPSLETNLTGWGYWNNSGTATVTQSNEQARFGSYSYKQIVTSDGNQGVYSYGANITEGNTYTMSFWVNITAIGAAESIPFYYRVWHSTGNYIIGTIATLTTTTNGWARYSMTQTIPTNGYTGNSLRLSFYTNKTGTTVYVDGVQIEQSSAVTPYADGSLGTGHSWSGTAHASTSTRTASAATNTTLLNNTSGSLSFWFNSPSLDTSAQCPLGTSDGDNTGGLFFGLKNSGIYLTHQYAVGQTVAPQSVAAISNTWNHVAYTWDNTTRQGNLYVNGTLQQNVSYPQTITIGEYIQNLGTCTRTGYTPFNGTLDDVRDYNRALTSAEVYKLYAWAPGPVGYWKMDEHAGTTTNDSSGNNYTSSTFTGNTEWTQGKYGSALMFDGTNDQAPISDQDVFSVSTTNQLTVETWVKLNSVTTQQHFISKNSDPNYEWEIKINGDGTPRATVYNTALGAYLGGDYAGPALLPNTWYHLAFTINTATPYLRYYVNGIQTLEDTTTSGTIKENTTAPLRIGEDGNGNNDVSGIIDEVQIYNYARTSGQIVEDMNAGRPTVGSSVGYWKFDEGYGTVANNSGYGGAILNGNITNASRTSEGKFGKTVNYDGTGDYTTVPNNSALNFGSSSFSVSYWLNFNPGSTQQRWIAGKGTPYQSSGAGWAIANWTTGDPITSTLYVSDGTGAPASHTVNFPSVSRGTWRQFTFVVDRAANVVKTYSNGVYYSQLDISSLGSFDSSNDLLIGTGNGTGNTSDVKIDEVKIYNAALTAEEVKQDFNKKSSLSFGSLSDTSALSGGSVASNSAGANYCVPGSSDVCTAPIAEWNFEEGNGGSVNDTSGNGNSGTWSGTGTHWTQGKIGKAGNFNNSNDNVTIPLLNHNNITVSAWVKRTSLDASNADSIFGGWYWNPDAQTRQGYDLRFYNNQTTLNWIVETTNGSTITEKNIYSSALNLGEWYYVTGTYDSVSGIARLYINGILSSSSTASPGNTIVPQSTYADMRIGYSRVNNGYYNGQIDQVRVFNYARNPSQISWDYNQGKPIAHYKLDECQGAVANDSSGNNNIGTIAIGATGTNTTVGTCTSSGAWADGASGRFNSSLELDGTDDEITTADSPSLDMANMTVSAWIKTSNAAEQCIVERNNSTFYFCTNGGKLSYWINGVAATWMVSNKSVNDGAWHHVLGTWDGTNKKLYIDGILDKTEAGSGGDMGSTTVGLNIGVRKNAGVPQNYFNGQIDEVKLYNYAQTAGQVKQQFNGGSAIRFGQF